jgi:3-isopropylmalate dehydrogenase
VFAPLGAWASSVAVERAFACAASRRGRVVTVGEGATWLEAVEQQRIHWDGLQTATLSLGEVLVALKERPETLDVIVTEPQLMSGLVDVAAHFAGSDAWVAYGWMQASGPGVFAPGASEPDDVAGFGVADPTGMLLTASLLLAEGLKRRAASRTLERAVGAVAVREGGAPQDTRRFTDAVIELLPEARTDIEHFDEVWQ